MENALIKKVPDKNKIAKLCRKYNIEKYYIKSDGSIDVKGDVNMGFQSLTKLPLKFNKVSGNFVAGNNQLTSFEGCPNEIGGDFDFFSNRVTSLDGCPQIVGRNFMVGYNSLKTLLGAPSIINGNFNCDHNELISLQGCPNITGFIWARHNYKLPKVVNEDFLLTRYNGSETFKTFIKYQDHFDVWENGFNENNYRELIAEIEDGLK